MQQLRVEDLYVGLRVVVNGEVCDMRFENSSGTIVCVDTGEMFPYGIEFDHEFPAGHNCGGAGAEGRCRFGFEEDLENIFLMFSEEELDVSDEDILVLDGFLSAYAIK